MATVRQLDSGRWQAIVRRRGTRDLYRTFAAKSDASRWARMAEADIERAVFIDRTEAERTTLAAVIDRYLVEVTPHKRSARRERQRLKALRTRFGQYSPAALQGAHIAEYRDSRLSAGCAGATVVKELNTLSHVLDVAAKDWGIALPHNVARLVRRPPVAQGRDRRLSPEEERRLLASCDASRARMLAPAVRFAIETAMRLGEILALRWGDIDAQRRVATLRYTKNGEMRIVPLSTAALACLARLPRRLGDDRVFWTWQRPDSFENAWRRAVAAAGIENLRFHDLRHEAVSRLFEHGFNLMEVAAVSGHKTLQMLKRYTHLRAEDLARRMA